jgi:hypothetical protein
MIHKALVVGCLTNPKSIIKSIGILACETEQKRVGDASAIAQGLCLNGSGNGSGSTGREAFRFCRFSAALLALRISTGDLRRLLDGRLAGPDAVVPASGSRSGPLAGKECRESSSCSRPLWELSVRFLLVDVKDRRFVGSREVEESSQRRGASHCA